MLAFLLAGKSVGNFEGSLPTINFTQEKKDFQTVIKEADGSDSEIGDEEFEEDDYSISNGFAGTSSKKNSIYNSRLNEPFGKIVLHNVLPLYILYNQLKVYS